MIIGDGPEVPRKRTRTRNDPRTVTLNQTPVRYRTTVTDRFYVELLFELGVHAQAGGTAEGAAAVAKRVARKHGVRAAEWVGLPRLTRAEREHLTDTNRA